MQTCFMMFMMWMMGNGIQIFSIMMTITGLTQPIMAIARSGQGERAAQRSARACARRARQLAGGRRPA
jgi:hypothetical protein